MANLRELRKRIASVKNTQKITNAMKMVSAARLRRAEEAIKSARPFADKMRDVPCPWRPELIPAPILCCR